MYLATLYISFVNLQGEMWAPLPSLIFGITGTLTGLLILLLPETRDRVLKDSVEEEEKEKEVEDESKSCLEEN